MKSYISRNGRRKTVKYPRRTYTRTIERRKWLSTIEDVTRTAIRLKMRLTPIRRVIMKRQITFFSWDPLLYTEWKLRRAVKDYL